MKRILAVLAILTVTVALVFVSCKKQQGAASGGSGQGVTTTVSPKALTVSPQAGDPIEYPQPATSYTTNPKYPKQPAVSNVNGFPITQQKVTLTVATPTSTTVLDYINNDGRINQRPY